MIVKVLKDLAVRVQAPIASLMAQMAELNPDMQECARECDKAAHVDANHGHDFGLSEASVG